MLGKTTPYYRVVQTVGGGPVEAWLYQKVFR